MSSYNRIKELAEESYKDLEERTNKLDKLWAFLAQGPNGAEGIIAQMIPDLGSTPLVTGKKSNIALMLPLAEEAQRRTGVPFRIIEFSVRKDITEECT